MLREPTSGCCTALSFLFIRVAASYSATDNVAKLRITFAGNWPTNARPIMDKVNRLFVLFFAVYITIIVFAALRVITAVFLRDTLDAARNDDDAQLQWKLASGETCFIHCKANHFDSVPLHCRCFFISPARCA